eukprot:scaffold305751_cov28-Tisochrysis_lutea.AAC.1
MSTRQARSSRARSVGAGSCSMATLRSRSPSSISSVSASWTPNRVEGQRPQPRKQSVCTARLVLQCPCRRKRWRQHQLRPSAAGRPRAYAILGCSTRSSQRSTRER